MVISIVRMEKMADIHRFFNQQGLLSGTVLEDIRASMVMDEMSNGKSAASEEFKDGDDEYDGGDDEADREENSRCVNQPQDDDQQAVDGDQSSLDDRLSDVIPASCFRKYNCIYAI